MVQMPMGEQDLNRLNVKLRAQRLKRLAFLRGGHARIDDRSLAIAVIDEISLLSKDIACEGMHHAA